MNLSDEEKLELSIDILKITQGIYKYTKHTCLQKVLLAVLRLGLYVSTTVQMFMCILPVTCKNYSSTILNR